MICITAFSPTLLSMLKMYLITKDNPHFQLTAAAIFNFAASELIQYLKK